MKAYCPDCGTGLDRGLCPYCHEESVILRDQYEDFDQPPSKEFIDKCAEQLKDWR